MSGARKTVDQLMAEAFGCPRDPRSDAYKAGVRAVLTFRIDRVRFKDPFPPGTAEGDAFQFGNQEGQRIWRATQEVERNSPSRQPEYL